MAERRDVNETEVFVESPTPPAGQSGIPATDQKWLSETLYLYYKIHDRVTAYRPSLWRSIIQAIIKWRAGRRGDEWYDPERILDGVLETLSYVSEQIRHYRMDPKKNGPSLDLAFREASWAALSMNRVEGGPLATYFARLRILLYFIFAYFILKLPFMYTGQFPFFLDPQGLQVWEGPAFYVDVFFIGGFGAFASWLAIYVTGRAGAPLSAENLSRLTASPFIAVALIALLSELTIGTANGGNVTMAAGGLTLMDASDGLRLGLAFLFGFFSDLSIGLMRRLFPTSKTPPEPPVETSPGAE